MSIYLLTNNNNYLSYWQKTFINSQTLSLSDIAKLNSNDILVLDEKLYATDLSIKAKVIILDNEPNFEKCMFYLNADIKAYGNIYMHSSHLLSAVEALRDNKKWIYPEYINQIIVRSNKKETESIEEKTKVLTKREKEMAKLILDGLTNKEIAQSMNISINTVKIHITNIYKKLHVNDRLSLFSYLNR